MCGEKQAKALAIAFREQLLAEREEKFVTFDPLATEATERAFASLLDGKPRPAIHQPLMSKTEIEAKAAEIDARYDTYLPSRLTVYVKVSPLHRDRLSVRVAGGVRGRCCLKARATSCSFKRNSFATAMQRAQDHIERSIMSFFGADTARRFLADHAAALSEKGFDREGGLNVDIPMPTPEQQARLKRFLADMPEAGSGDAA